MKILVLVKRVIDPYAKPVPNAAGTDIDYSTVKFEINPFDEIALEEAVRLKEAGMATQVVILSVGAAEAQEQLRKGLAMGADEAILVESADDWDPLALGKELKSWIDEIQPNLILMGKQSTDGDNNQIGQILATLLDWPLACNASKLTVAGESVTVERETDMGEETVQFNLPGIVTADLRLNEPRYIALPAIIKARSKPLAQKPPKSGASSRIKLVSVSSPPPRAAGKKVGSVPELVAALKERGAL